MATFNRPAALPLWCEDNPTNVVQPPNSLTQAGYTEGDVMVAGHFNWELNQLGHWIAYLDQAAGSTLMATTLDMNTRLTEGGHWSFNATTRQLSWDADAVLSIPGAAAADNTLPAGSAVLAPGQALYVSAHVPYSTNVDVTQGSATLANVLVPSQIAVGQQAVGMGLPANTTVLAIDDSNVTLSQAATATAQQVPVTFVGTGPLAPAVATMATFTPSPSMVILALASNNTCAVGANSNQMLLRHLESKRLLGAGYVGTLEAAAGQALAQGQAVYVSAGTADGRTLGALYPCEAGATNGATRNQFVGFCSMAAAAGATVHAVTSGLVGGFSGLTVGAAYYLDLNTPGSITTAKPNSAGQYAVAVGQAVTTSVINIFAAGGRANVAIGTGDQEVTGALQVDGNTTLKGRLYTPGGIKTSVAMGALWCNSWANADEQATRITLYNIAGTNNQAGVMDRYWPATHAGSVVGVAVWLYSSQSQGGNLNIRLNRNTILYNYALPAPAAATWTPYVLSFPLGQLPFKPGDTLLVTVLNFATGANVQVSCDLTVELAT